MISSKLSVAPDIINLTIRIFARNNSCIGEDQGLWNNYRKGVRCPLHKSISYTDQLASTRDHFEARRENRTPRTHTPMQHQKNLSWVQRPKTTEIPTTVFPI